MTLVAGYYALLSWHRLCTIGTFHIT